MCTGNGSKFGLIFFNFIVILSGVGIVVAGLCLPNPKEKLKLYQFKSDNLDLLATAVIITGVLVGVIGFLGWYGAVCESRCLLLMYSTVLLVLIVGGFVALGLFYGTPKKKLDVYIKNETDFTFKHYYNTTEYSTVVDCIQSWFECCGTVSKDKPWTEGKGKGIPHTCRKIIDGKIQEKKYYEKGCTPTLIEFAERSKKRFIWIVLASELVQITFLLCAMNVIAVAQAKGNYSRFK